MPTDAILHEVATKKNMTKTSPVDTPRGFSASARQALERAAVRGHSAASVLRLLTRRDPPRLAASGPTLHASLLPRPVSPPADRPLAIGTPFEQWAALTDAYAEQFLRMQRGDPRARNEAMRLSREMLRMNEEMGCMA